jgi:hypothetical protein
MDRVACQEEAHIVALVGGGAGNEQGERCPRRVLGTSGGVNE